MTAFRCVKAVIATSIGSVGVVRNVSEGLEGLGRLNSRSRAEVIWMEMEAIAHRPAAGNRASAPPVH
jgi:hypothetical protein